MRQQIILRHRACSIQLLTICSVIYRDDNDIFVRRECTTVIDGLPGIAKLEGATVDPKQNSSSICWSRGGRREDIQESDVLVSLESSTFWS